MAKKDEKNKAILALIVNLVLPGVGSLLGGKIGSGIGQIALSGIGLFLTVSSVVTFVGFMLGIPLMIVGWIWALVTGIMLVSEAK